MAVGDVLAEWDSMSMHTFGSSYGRVDFRAGHYVRDLDADVAAGNGAYCLGRFTLYGGNAIELDAYFSMSSATTGNVVLFAAFERIGVETHDIDSGGWAASQSTTDAVPVTSGHRAKATIRFENNQIDDLQNLEEFRVYIARTGDDASDDAVGDLELSRIVLREVA